MLNVLKIQKKWGALCYPEEGKEKTCQDIGYDSCGPGACSLTTQNCASAIWDMVTGTFLGLLKFTIFVLSAGTSAAVEGVAKTAE